MKEGHIAARISPEDAGQSDKGGGMNRLQIIPMDLAGANELVRRWHRHHRPVIGYKFAIGVALGETIVGAAIVGRPVARHRDDGWTLEVVRCVTDGTRNACSALYGAAWRAARALGYQRLLTYTLPEESGASLRGAGWRVIGQTEGQSWSRPSRPRIDKHPIGSKLIWEVGE